MWRGARRGEEAAVRELFAGLRIVPLGSAEGELAGSWRGRFAEKGTTLSQSDCLVAAAAFRSGARLATGDIHGFPMSELEVELWPAGR